MKLTSSLNRDPTFSANVTFMSGLVDDLRQHVEKISKGGGDKARERHLSRGKLLARDRIEALLDPGSVSRILAIRSIRGLRRTRSGRRHRHRHRSGRRP